MTDRRDGPAFFEADHPALSSAPPPVEDAPPIRGPEEPAAARAMRAAARGRGAGLARWFWGATFGFIGLVASVATYDFIAAMLARNPVLGSAAGALAALAVGAALLAALRELAGLARLGKIEETRASAEAALREGDAAEARKALAGLRRLYARRPDMEWRLADLKTREAELFDAPAIITHAERSLLPELDARAVKSAEKAARIVASATALVPMAFADVAAALYANLRMIREIAEIYGGRAGWLGSWRLLKAVAGHLVATGAVAVGDDLIGPALGGGVLSKLSRRFGEGLINGALTARVGAAAIEVCRPLPFHSAAKPSGRGIAAGALTGLAR